MSFTVCIYIYIYIYIYIFIIPKCDTAPVVNNLMQVISKPLRTGPRTTHLCGTGVERVVWQRELPERHLTEMTGEWRSENLTNFEVLV